MKITSLEEAISYSFKVGNCEAIQLPLENLYGSSTLNTGNQQWLYTNLFMQHYANTIELASKNGHFLVVSQLLDLVTQSSGIDHTYAHFSALIAATESCHTRIVELLLRSKISPNPPANNKQPSALHLASEKGHVDLVSTLLHFGADPNAEMYSNQCTPLMIAAASGQIEVIRVLLRDERVVVNKKAKDETTALHFATIHNHYDIVQLLIGSGASLNQQQQYSFTKDLLVIPPHVPITKIKVIVCLSHVVATHPVFIIIIFISWTVFLLQKL